MTALVWLLLAWAPLSGGQPRQHTVVLSAFQFAPREVRVSVGDTVRFENRDIVPHTAKADDGTWDSGHIAAKAKAHIVARQKGEYAFTCLYHSNMKGKLIVR